MNRHRCNILLYYTAIWLCTYIYIRASRTSCCYFELSRLDLHNIEHIRVGGACKKPSKRIISHYDMSDRRARLVVEHDRRRPHQSRGDFSAPTPLLSPPYVGWVGEQCLWGPCGKSSTLAYNSRRFGINFSPYTMPIPKHPCTPSCDVPLLFYSPLGSRVAKLSRHKLDLHNFALAPAPVQCMGGFVRGLYPPSRTATLQRRRNPPPRVIMELLLYCVYR